MLHPSQFKVNEAWIVFKLNTVPIQTEQDGDFNMLALMDAASCFILTSASVPAMQAEPAEVEVKRVLLEGQARSRHWPKTLFIPVEQAAEILMAEAERVGMEVVRLPEEQLSVFIGEAQQGFRERFGGGGLQ